MAAEFRFGIIERLAVTAFVVGVAGVVASLTLPPPIQNWLIETGLGPYFFGLSLVVIAVSVVFFLGDLLLYWIKKRRITQSMGLVVVGTVLIVLGSITGLIGAFRVDRESMMAGDRTQRPNENSGATKPSMPGSNIPAGFGLFMDQASQVLIEGGQFSGPAGGVSVNRSDNITLRGITAFTEPTSAPSPQNSSRTLVKVTPSGALRSLSNAQLSDKGRELAGAIRSYESDLQSRYAGLASTFRSQPNAMESETAKIFAERDSVFASRFLRPAQELMAEIIWRIGRRVSFDDPKELEGAHAVATGTLVGTRPLFSTALYLDDLASRLSP